MIELIALYILVGLITYWPMAFFLLDTDVRDSGKWYQWATAWAMWCITWPIWNAMNAWYWWRAKK